MLVAAHHGSVGAVPLDDVGADFGRCGARTGRRLFNVVDLVFEDCAVIPAPPDIRTCHHAVHDRLLHAAERRAMVRAADSIAPLTVQLPLDTRPKPAA